MKIAIPLLVAATLALPASATTLRITVTNDQAATDATGDPSSRGFALTPVYTAFHNGDFDSYTPGEAASSGLEQLAEVGNFMPIRDARIAATTDQGNPSVGATFATQTPGGPRPIFGGESVTQDIEITNVATQRFFSFLSMVIPTNDLFIGNGDPMGIELFDINGIFNGNRTIQLTGADIRDAGTEVNDANVGVAFAAGQDGGAGATEGGVVTNDGFSELSRYVGLDTVAGFQIDEALADTLINFANNPAGFAVATITIEQVAPVPLPAGGLMLLSAVGAGAIAARRKKAAASA